METLDSLISTLVASGLMGLLGLCVLERVLYVLPSSALLMAAGAAVGNGQWPLMPVVLISVLGSLIGCAGYYALGMTLGEPRAQRAFGNVARVLGVSRPRWDGLMQGMRAQNRSLAVVAQLVPTVRLIAPGIAGSFRLEPRAFLLGTGLGVSLWNSAFIAAGYGAVIAARGPAIAAVSREIVLGVVGVAALLVFAWRWHRLRGPQIETVSGDE